MWEKAGRTLARVAGTLLVMVVASPAIAEATADWKCNAQTEVPLDERIAACTSIIDQGKYGRPALIRAYFNRAAAYNKKRQFERAAADYSAVLELYPANTYAYYGRAYSYVHSDDFDRAFADYDRVIQLNPRSSHAYYCRGVAHQKKREYDQAISDFTRAIELRYQNRSGDQNAAVNDREGDLAPPAFADDRAALSSGAIVFNWRGSAHFGKGDFDAAIADFDQAIRLYPNYKYAFISRCAVHNIKGDFDRAIADCDRAAQLDPEDARVYRNRGILHLHNGSLSKSLADLDEARRLDPGSAYGALWREIVARRSDQPSQLAEAATRLDMTKWPAPIVRLFLGETTAEEVLAAADDKDPVKKKGQVCEANFFTAELALLRGFREEALRLFDLAATDCPRTFVEWQAANAELGALRANP
jgi:lipoprotein NlpI